MAKILTCLHCGKEFEPRDARQKCCSKKCGERRWFSVFGRESSRKSYQKNKKKIREKLNERYRKDPEYRGKAVEYMRRRRVERAEIVKEINYKYRAKPESRARAIEKTRLWYQKFGADQNKRRGAQRQIDRVVHPWRTIVGSARDRAKAFGLVCNLTPEWARKNWTGKCSVSGLPFALGLKRRVNIFSPSIDRIDPSVGYTQENCRFVLFGVNALKCNGTDDEMRMVAESIVMRMQPHQTVEGILSLPG